MTQLHREGLKLVINHRLRFLCNKHKESGDEDCSLQTCTLLLAGAILVLGDMVEKLIPERQYPPRW